MVTKRTFIKSPDFLNDQNSSDNPVAPTHLCQQNMVDLTVVYVRIRHFELFQVVNKEARPLATEPTVAFIVNGSVGHMASCLHSCWNCFQRLDGRIMKLFSKSFI